MKRIIVGLCVLVAVLLGQLVYLRLSSGKDSPTGDFYPLQRVSVVAEKGAFSPDVITAKALRPVSIPTRWQPLPIQLNWDGRSTRLPAPPATAPPAKATGRP
ncbi:MAG: hypothetical protein HY673_02720 [Chloroflexi bacterium]|nr:hypothetical protein [Chloroflexota bacterium]